jgi:RNA polymerase sigma-70 factor (ECF subfamily)
MDINDVTARAAFDRLLGELRPKLHRYCARMTGSAIDGEDVVQEALMKAIEAYAAAATIDNPEAWIFRIAHNAALDFLRGRSRRAARQADEEIDMIADPTPAVEHRSIAAASLHAFMRLPPAQRSSVILMDVLGYTVEEISGIIAATVPAVKAALNRGRVRLRELAHEDADRPAPVLPEAERIRLAAYVARFNARDFDAIRDMLAEDVRLDLISRTRLTGKQEVSRYFGNYSKVHDWVLAPGLVDGRAAIIVRDPEDLSGPPKYFIVIDWRAAAVTRIRDFRHARYALEGAEVIVLGDSKGEPRKS